MHSENLIKFKRHYVTNGNAKARIWYSVGHRIDGRKCVNLYSKSYSDKLALIFSSTKNDTDLMTDYFETDKVTIFENDPNYLPALKMANFISEQRTLKQEQRK